MTSITRFIVTATITTLLLSRAKAAVVVDTVEGRVADFARAGEIKESFAASIENGLFDDRHWNFPVRELITGKLRYVELSSKAFLRLPGALQAHILQYLATPEENLRAYRVSVDMAKNNLAAEPVIKALKINVTRLAGIVPAEELLSSFARAWAYRLSSASSYANCYFTAIASLFEHWSAPRHMKADEFTYDIRNYFARVTAPAAWGDIIYLYKNDHAFVYLGHDRKNPARALVFTKNGYRQSHFIFMSFADVVALYGASEAAYFRRNASAVDVVSDDPVNVPAISKPPFDGVNDVVLERFIEQHPPELSLPLAISKLD